MCTTLTETATENCQAARCQLEAVRHQPHYVGTLLARVRAHATASDITPPVKSRRLQLAASSWQQAAGSRAVLSCSCNLLFQANPS
jgi:hypothetical protein